MRDHNGIALDLLARSRLSKPLVADAFIVRKDEQDAGPLWDCSLIFFHQNVPKLSTQLRSSLALTAVVRTGTGRVAGLILEERVRYGRQRKDHTGGINEISMVTEEVFEFRTWHDGTWICREADLVPIVVEPVRLLVDKPCHQKGEVGGWLVLLDLDYSCVTFGRRE